MEASPFPKYVSHLAFINQHSIPDLLRNNKKTAMLNDIHSGTYPGDIHPIPRTHEALIGPHIPRGEDLESVLQGLHILGKGADTDTNLTDADTQ